MIRKLKRVINNDYTLSVLSKIITAVIGIISSAFSTRYLGIQYKGDYAYISHVASILVLVFNLGIYQSYSYNYKKYGENILKKYTDIFYFQFVIFLFITVVLLATINDPIICMIIMLVPFNILKMQYSNIGLIENIRLSLFLTVFNAIISAFCYIALYFWAQPGVIYVVILTIAVDIVTIIVFSIKLKIVPKIWEVDMTFLKEVLKFGIIPMISALLATINYSIDIIFLKQMGSPVELSYYALAATIINYVWMIPDAFKSVLFSKTAKKMDIESIEFCSQTSIASIVICFVGFALLGRFFLALVYGSDFKNSYGVTLLLILGAFAMSIFKVVGIVLVSQGKRVAHFISLAVSSVINVLLNWLLIPRMGMYGAGIASVCSYTVCGTVLLIYFCKLYSIPASRLIFPSSQTITRIKGLFSK
ncbi:MAG: polysaccharide biosynthesis C-terminal domain-containing protein [Clostridia bacterium]|nr:polysaccharide biosynthesis C-terminal domain-containing protein [Clostridia bacterium]MBR4576575.1 polysaccharide biosynthesis C-terminal domain-containing protein [Clostridia bacterium]